MNSKILPKVLVLSRNYPNNITPILGLWVAGLVRHIARLCEIKVIAPIPYCPPLPGLHEFTRFRSIEKKHSIEGIDVFHPRFITGPGYSTYNFESRLYYWSIVRQVDRLREKFPFDIIHANFGYPDGVVAAKLAARYNVPFIITEHASWTPWMDEYPKVRERAVRAVEQCAFHIAVSGFARRTIARFTGDADKLCVVPNGVDVNVFKPDGQSSEAKKPNQILYVGYMRHVKGLDVLLEAMKLLIEKQPAVRLVLVGGGIYRDSQIQVDNLRQLAEKLGIARNVEFAGIKPPQEVARYMRESTLLVLPSRKETFGAVLVEALACGTPVVATRCGGTEDIVTREVGRLVPVEHPQALADAMLEIISQPDKFNPASLRDYTLQNFAWEQIARRTVDLYRKAIDAGNN